MRFYTRQHRFYCGVDLHARSMHVCVLDQEGNVLVSKSIASAPEPFLELTAPYREDVAVAAECMFTWYWLADLRARESSAQGHDPLALAIVRTVYGRGQVLGLSILYEIQDITRFARVQPFLSYSCGSKHIATITRVPMSVQRQRCPPHQNSCPIVNSPRLIAGVVDDNVPHEQPAPATRSGAGDGLSQCGC